MWIDGGKWFHFSTGRDYMRQAHYSVVLCFGHRGVVPEGDSEWRRIWCVSTYSFERRLEVWKWKWRNRKTRHEL